MYEWEGSSICSGSGDGASCRCGNGQGEIWWVGLGWVGWLPNVPCLPGGLALGIRADHRAVKRRQCDISVC